MLSDWSFFKNLWVIALIVGMLDVSRPHGRAMIQALLPRLVAFSEDHPVDEYL